MVPADLYFVNSIRSSDDEALYSVAGDFLSGVYTLMLFP